MTGKSNPVVLEGFFDPSRKNKFVSNRGERSLATSKLAEGHLT